jgi:hypothetical protein
LGNKIENEMGGTCSTYEEEESDIYRVLVGKSDGKRPLGNPRHRWEENIKMNLQEVGCGGMNWIDLAHDREMWWACVNFLTS